ncbi:hypothetical protein EYF80_037258 [Liparis tanakae]|uniref:Uncharacterized protein n=1 Tax=Liparis tanakae TaxID=230148 RepID=A0A4Z2GH55_9TELE|nr:hypothetical protein EYF80_037258 [Liparis tanakae]
MSATVPLGLRQVCSPLHQPDEDLCHQGEVGGPEVLHGDQAGVAQRPQRLRRIASNKRRISATYCTGISQSCPRQRAAGCPVMCSTICWHEGATPPTCATPAFRICGCILTQSTMEQPAEPAHNNTHAAGSEPPACGLLSKRLKQLENAALQTSLISQMETQSGAEAGSGTEQQAGDEERQAGDGERQPGDEERQAGDEELSDGSSLSLQPAAADTEAEEVDSGESVAEEERTLTDHLNKRLLSSFLEKLNQRDLALPGVQRLDCAGRRGVVKHRAAEWWSTGLQRGGAPGCRVVKHRAAEWWSTGLQSGGAPGCRVVEHRAAEVEHRAAEWWSTRLQSGGAPGCRGGAPGCRRAAEGHADVFRTTTVAHHQPHQDHRTRCQGPEVEVGQGVEVHQAPRATGELMSMCQLSCWDSDLVLLVSAHGPLVLRVRPSGGGPLVLERPAGQGPVAGSTLACVAGQNPHGVLAGGVETGAHSQPQGHAEAHQEPREGTLRREERPKSRERVERRDQRVKKE